MLFVACLDTELDLAFNGHLQDCWYYNYSRWAHKETEAYRKRVAYLAKI